MRDKINTETIITRHPDGTKKAIRKKASLGPKDNLSKEVREIINKWLNDKK